MVNDEERGQSEFPVLVHRFDGPFELLPQSLGEELLYRHVESLGKHRGQTRIDVVLSMLVRMSKLD